MTQTGKFVPMKNKSDSHKSSGHDEDITASIQALKMTIEELEREMAKAEKSKSSKSGRIDRLVRPLTKDTLHDFQAWTSTRTAWMIESLDLVRTAVEENILDKPPVITAAHLLAMVVKCQKRYERKYSKYGKKSKSSKKKHAPRSRSRSWSWSRGRSRNSSKKSKDKKGRRHRSKSTSASLASGSSGSSGDDADVEYYYEENSVSGKSMVSSMSSPRLVSAGVQTGPRLGTAIRAGAGSGSGDALVNDEVAPQVLDRSQGMEPVNLKSQMTVSGNGPNVSTTYANVRVFWIGERWLLSHGQIRHSIYTSACQGNGYLTVHVWNEASANRITTVPLQSGAATHYRVGDASSGQCLWSLKSWTRATPLSQRTSIGLYVRKRDSPVPEGANYSSAGEL